MKVWIIQTAEPLHTDTDGLRPMRAINLSNALVAAGHEVVIWSSSFNHYTKKHRYPRNTIVKVSDKLDIAYFTSKGYKSHKGLSRLLDHLQMAINLNKLLRNAEKPDVAFVGFPPLETAWIASKFLKKNRIPFVLDVKDEWPEIILREFPEATRGFLKSLLWPYFKIRDSTFSRADALSSVTPEFLSWCLNISRRDKNVFDFVAPTTSSEEIVSEDELKEANSFWDRLGVEGEKENRIYFVGTINYVYDFGPVISAARNLDIQLIVAGDGPQKRMLEAEAADLPNVLFPGWITYPQAYVLANRSAIAIAPFVDRSDFEMNVTNKFYDALRLGKPMLTSNLGAAGIFVTRECVGFQYKNVDPHDFEKVLEVVLGNKNMLRKYSENALALFSREFDGQTVYARIVNFLEDIALGLNPKTKE
jgi:glycosyltransferase involved in cell wall biosynthesis